MTKKEFHTLVDTQWKRSIEGKNKDDRPKKAKDSNTEQNVQELHYLFTLILFLLAIVQKITPLLPIKMYMDEIKVIIEVCF